MTKHEQKEQKIEAMLALLRKEPMNRLQIADALGVTVKAVHEYLAICKRERLIYVECWVRTSGQQSPYWRAGNKTGMPKPEPKREVEYKRKLGRRLKNPPPSEFEPRRDIAASWF